MLVVAYVGLPGVLKEGSSFTLVTFAIQFTTVLAICKMCTESLGLGLLFGLS